MGSLIIYASKTGFTKRYAEWLAGRLDADISDIRAAKSLREDRFGRYDTIIYGGWAKAESVTGAKWFLEKASSWKDKKLALFCVGSGPAENPQVEPMFRRLLSDEQRARIRTFYLQGGLDYDKMSAPSRLAMKMFASMLKKKKDATAEDMAMAERISHSFDASDERYIEPIVSYVTGG